ADVDLEVDVTRAAPVPRWVDRVEDHLPSGIADLVSAQKRQFVGWCGAPAATASRASSRGGARAVTRVDTQRVGVPDLDIRVFDRLACGGVLHLEVEGQRDAGLVLGDVAPDQVVGDVGGARCDLGGQHAGRNSGTDRIAGGSFGYRGARAMDRPERRRTGASQNDESPSAT